jgi:exopolysaccharide production protein ExoQ
MNYRWSSFLTIVVASSLLGVLLSLSLSTLDSQYQLYAIVGILAIAILSLFAVIAWHSQQSELIIAIFLFLLVFIIDTSFRTRAFEEIVLDWQSLLKLGLFSIALVLGITGLKRTYKTFQHLSLGALVGYGGIALLSTLYSSVPLYTFAAALGFWGIILFIPWALDYLSPRKFVNIMIAALALLQIASWLWYIVFPEKAVLISWTPEGGVERLAGLTHSNLLGRAAAITLGLCVTSLWSKWEIRPKLFLLLIIMALSLWTLVETQSRGSMGAMIGAIALIYCLTHKLKRSFIFLLIVGGISLIFWLISDQNLLQNLSVFIARTGDVQELSTLTGRTFIWQLAWSLIARSPWIGYGYASTRIILPQNWDINTMPFSQAHSLFLESLLYVGIVGTAFLVISIVLALVYMLRILREQSNESYPFVFMLLFNLISGLIERGMVGVPNISTITFVTSIAFLAAYVNEREKGSAPAYPG